MPKGVFFQFISILPLVAASNCSKGGTSTDYCSSTAEHATTCGEGGVWNPISGSCQGYANAKCHQCYSGKWCQHKAGRDSCILVGGGGFPKVFEEYWGMIDSKAASGDCAKGASQPNNVCSSSPATVKTDYNMVMPGMVGSDEGQIPSSMIIPELDAELRKLHANVGNVKTDGYYLIPTAGSTQAMAAVLSALAYKHGKGKPLPVFTQVPYYGAYAGQSNTTVDFMGNQAMYWDDATAQSLKFMPQYAYVPEDAIEINTYPNNPDNVFRPSKVLDDNKVVYDCVYLWPQYIEDYDSIMKKPLEFPIMTFSGSKLTGHAGSRFGWALVKDKELATGIEAYMSAQTLGLSIDTQIRFLGLIKHLNSEFEAKSPVTMFSYVQGIFKKRWAHLNAVFHSKKVINPIIYCQNSDTKGAYVWLKCGAFLYMPGWPPQLQPPCAAIVGYTAGIIGMPGVAYGDDMDSVRLTLLGPNVEFEIILAKIKKMMWEYGFKEHMEFLTKYQQFGGKFGVSKGGAASSDMSQKTTGKMAMDAFWGRTPVVSHNDVERFHQFDSGSMHDSSISSKDGTEHNAQELFTFDDPKKEEAFQRVLNIGGEKNPVPSEGMAFNKIWM